MRTHGITQPTSEPIAHLYKKDNEWIVQSNREHCEGVAELAAKFAGEFGMGSWGRVMGLLHDRGKERAEFQDYIVSSSGMRPEVRAGGDKNHSYIGAVITHEYAFDKGLCWLSNAIAGHHRGLYDIGNLSKVIDVAIPQEVDASKPPIPLQLPAVKPSPGSECSHIGRMLFSCLVDADRLDTEKFMNPEESKIREGFADLTELHYRLDKYREELRQKPDSTLNQLRQEIQSYCDAAALQPAGFFELTVPTGGGKTLASVIWAIRHALHNNKRRVIIAIPFTSIIVQTAEILRKIFGKENVVEHHSAVNESDDEEADHKNSLAAENWDAPIVVTTNVQLFESIFSNKPSACRKLHSICNSVVILDEAQTLPRNMLQPIVNAMKAYRKLFGTSFLFCTASQPVLHGRHRGRGGSVFQGIEEQLIKPIIPDGVNLFSRMRRVELSINLDRKNSEEVAEEIARHPYILCVVNTRKIALEIYKALPLAQDKTFHLSRLMCQAHILDTLETIKERLKRGEETQVVSTQLIEAGVDIDFPVVMRQLAGLDSILQAAGRCNREGKSDIGIAQVFQMDCPAMRGSMGRAEEVMKDMVDLCPESDWFSPDVMEKYYTALYQRTDYFDKLEIERMADDVVNCRYEEIGKSFKMIDDESYNVIVNYGNADRLVEQLKEYGPSRKLSRKLGRYAVNVHKRDFHEFQRYGLVEEVFPGVFYIPLKEQYDLHTGLKLDNQYLEETFMV